MGRSVRSHNTYRENSATVRCRNRHIERFVRSRGISKTSPSTSIRKLRLDKSIPRSTIQCKLEVFVANRIGKILRNTDRRQWRHVPGKCNPADFFSRGIDPKNIHELEEFHQGQAFLRQDPTFLIDPT